jgi:hypothetical protein
MTSKLFELPNIRKIYIPDPGYVIWDADLKGADAQVVAWEAEDDDLKAAFRAGLDVHDKNARDMWGAAYTSLPGGPDIPGSPMYKKRKQCKQGVHATNYGGKAPNLAKILNWTVHETDQFQKRWFSIHPGIRDNFHRRVQDALATTRRVTNAFGYHRIYFDRIDIVFPQALAWIPQSTVALLTYRGARQLESRLPWMEELMQVHDSLVYQSTSRYSAFGQQIREALTCPIPYPDPLTIQWGLAMSATSWGDVRSV